MLGIEFTGPGTRERKGVEIAADGSIRPIAKKR
jgi:hypothetical protein